MDGTLNAREVDDLDTPFALVVCGGRRILAVQRGLLKTEDIDLLDRLLMAANELRTAHFADMLNITA